VVGVFFASASSRGRALIDRRLCLPEQTWCQDTERRTRSGSLGHLAFATKPALAGQTIAAAMEAGISAPQTRHTARTRAYVLCSEARGLGSWPSPAAPGCGSIRAGLLPGRTPSTAYPPPLGTVRAPEPARRGPTTTTGPRSKPARVVIGTS
jgi:hypothetical protein